MPDHPIQGLMKTVMESIKEMVDVNTIVGEAVETEDGNVIIPVSRVSFGFAAGGGEHGGPPPQPRQRTAGSAEEQEGTGFPFAGGSGAGVSIHPVAFLVVGRGQVRLLSVDGRPLFDRLVDFIPFLLDRVHGLVVGGEPREVETKRETTTEEYAL